MGPGGASAAMGPGAGSSWPGVVQSARGMPSAQSIPSLPSVQVGQSTQTMQPVDPVQTLKVLKPTISSGEQVQTRQMVDTFVPAPRISQQAAVSPQTQMQVVETVGAQTTPIQTPVLSMQTPVLPAPE